MQYFRAGGRCLLPFCCLWLASCASLENIARDLTDEIGVPMVRSGGLSYLPLDRWLTRETITVKTIAFCREGECSVPVAVLLVEASGDDAREIKAVLAHPQRLADAMNARNAERRKAQRQLTKGLSAKLKGLRIAAKVETRVQPLVQHGLRGFTLSMTAAAGGRQVHAVVFSSSKRGTVRCVVALSPERQGAMDAALQAARQAFER